MTEVADEDRKNVAEEMFGKIMAANFPKSVKGKKTTDRSVGLRVKSHIKNISSNHINIKQTSKLDDSNMA